MTSGFDLLEEIQETALEPAYAESQGETRGGPVLAVTLALVAALLVFAGSMTRQGSAEVAAERASLAERVRAEQQRRDALEQELDALERQVRELRDGQVADPAVRTQTERLEILTGAAAVTGPGIVVTANDGPGEEHGLIYDSDLSRLVNGLREAGAEAIAVNGRRLSTLTPIRTAGSAVTVDYVSLSPPYRVEAIGDPVGLQTRFARTSAAAWWYFMRDNYGVTFDIAVADGDLDLPADQGMVLRHATVGR